MTIQDWGAIGEIFGAIAVVFTIFYLARQMRQNNLLGQAEAERDWFAVWHNTIRSLMGTRDSASITRKGLNIYGEMHPDEKAVFSTNMICLFDYADVLRRLHSKGYAPDDVLEPVMQNLLGMIKTPGGAQWWEQVGPILTIYDYIETQHHRDTHQITDVMDYLDAATLANLEVGEDT